MGGFKNSKRKHARLVFWTKTTIFSLLQAPALGV